jgi:type II secretory pathway component GspD/PulD (secretin)
MKKTLVPAICLLLSACCHDERDDRGITGIYRPPEPESAGYAPAPKGAKSIAVERKQAGRLVGRWPRGAVPIDLDEQKSPVRDVLQKLAGISRLNFVIADEVGGRVTAKLRQVPWTRALAAVLEAKDLVAVKQGNVVRILRRTDWYQEIQKSD